MSGTLSDVKIFSFRLKDILDELLTITINDFSQVLKVLNLYGGTGNSSINFLFFVSFTD